MELILRYVSETPSDTATNIPSEGAQQTELQALVVGDVRLVQKSSIQPEKVFRTRFAFKYAAFTEGAKFVGGLDQSGALVINEVGNNSFCKSVT
ncbi:hypothetical protein AB3N61_06670 [Leptospira sp. WS58.C1]|uniref:hypothetical protein n=1 Tax=Leptospira cinconiae TaxID=3235173 RepID=UPI00349F0125